MKRNYRLMGLILEWIAKNHDGKGVVEMYPKYRKDAFEKDYGDEPTVIPGCSERDLRHYLNLMAEGGLLSKNHDGDITGITWKGYDLLDEFLRWK